MAGKGKELAGSTKKRGKPQSSTTPNRKSLRVKQEAASEVRPAASDTAGVEIIEVRSDVPKRSIIPEISIDREFLETHQLGEVMRLLEAQGWGKLFQEDVYVNEDQVREFYQKLTVSMSHGLYNAMFFINGEVYSVNHRNVAEMLRVPASGYAEYIKTTWPADVAKADVILRVGEDPSNSSKQGRAQALGVKNRTLHRLLCSTIMPRMQKYTTINYQEFLIMDKLLLEEPISFPKLILQHMEHCLCTKGHGLPYPGIVKKILEFTKVYNAENETLVSSCLTMDAYEKLSWKYDETKGWMNTKFGLTPDSQSDDTESMFSVSSKDTIGPDTPVMAGIVKKLESATRKLRRLEAMIPKIQRLDVIEEKLNTLLEMGRNRGPVNSDVEILNKAHNEAVEKMNLAIKGVIEDIKDGGDKSDFPPQA